MYSQHLGGRGAGELGVQGHPSTTELRPVEAT